MQEQKIVIPFDLTRSNDEEPFLCQRARAVTWPSLFDVVIDRFEIPHGLTRVSQAVFLSVLRNHCGIRTKNVAVQKLQGRRIGLDRQPWDPRAPARDSISTFVSNTGIRLHSKPPSWRSGKLRIDIVPDRFESSEITSQAGARGAQGPEIQACRARDIVPFRAIRHDISCPT